MAATSGIGAVTAVELAGDLLDHITPSSGTVATAVTVTGPLKCKLFTTVIKNDTRGTECTDANYAFQSVTAWNAKTVTSGSGYNVGIVQKTSNLNLVFGGGTGFATTQTFTGLDLDSSDATAVMVFYQNFAASLTVPSGNQYIILSGNLTVGIS